MRSADKGDGVGKVISKVPSCPMVSWTSEKPRSVFQEGTLIQEAKRQLKISKISKNKILKKLIN